MLVIHNSLTGKKQPFQPLEPGRVRIYVCGITVYDYLHLGHARMLVVFDMVVRYLRWRGYEVTYVRNITDIDDKIIKRAAENGEPMDALTERFIAAMDADSDALGIVRPDQEPRATEHLPAIIRMIEQLAARGHAYQGANSDVYYRVASFSDYGVLSGKRLVDLRAGARVDVSEAKEDPLDFVLWKAAKPGEPSWPSPWGPGRPGWHIECSAMSTEALGNHFDIHGGGMDLKFPHHENEIAQSCGATGEAFVNLWMHNGFVEINEEKMSKSLGNFFTVREILEQFPAEAVRFFVLSSHYRSPLHHSDDNIAQARATLDGLYQALRGVDIAAGESDSKALADFQAAMDDDFNTPGGIAVMQSVARELNRARVAGDDTAAGIQATTLRTLGGVLGLLEQDPEFWFRGAGKGSLSDPEIEAMIEARRLARDRRDWAEADRLRDALADDGVLLEDAAGRTTWKRT
jgi:cysteinyl-tRNA synthetase